MINIPNYPKQFEKSQINSSSTCFQSEQLQNKIPASRISYLQFSQVDLFMPQFMPMSPGMNPKKLKHAENCPFQLKFIF